MVDSKHDPATKTTTVGGDEPDGMLAYMLAIQNPSLDDPSWPLPSFDARDWAEAFCKLNPSMDEGVMLAWFANALMRGFDEAQMRSVKHAETT